MALIQFPFLSKGLGWSIPLQRKAESACGIGGWFRLYNMGGGGRWRFTGGQSCPFPPPPLLSATVQEEEPGWWWSLGKPAAQSYPRSLTSLLRAFYTEEGM